MPLAEWMIRVLSYNQVPSPSYFNFLTLFWAVLGFPGCIGAFSSCGEQGLLHRDFLELRRAGAILCCGGYSLLPHAGFSLQRLLLLLSAGSRHLGFSSCSVWALDLWFPGSRGQARQLWCTGLVAL